MDNPAMDIQSDDFLMKVLCYLPAKILQAFKSVAPQWRLLIQSLVFVQLQVVLGAKVLEGFFFGDGFPRTPGNNSSVTFIPVDNNDTPPNNYSTVMSFLPVARVSALSTSNGLVCCRSVGIFEPSVQVFVCNPLNRSYKEIRWPYGNDECMVSIVFNPARDVDVNGVRFKVVVAYDWLCDLGTAVECIHFNVYSSDTRRCREDVSPCITTDKLIPTTGVEVGGALHWLTDRYNVIYFDPESDMSYIISPPVETECQQCLLEAVLGLLNGVLTYTTVTTDGIEVYELVYLWKSLWNIKFRIDWMTLRRQYNVNIDGFRSIGFLVEVHAHHPHHRPEDRRPWVCPLANKEDTLILRVNQGIYDIRLKTLAVRRLSDVEPIAPNGMNETPVVLPYTMSLVPLTQ